MIAIFALQSCLDDKVTDFGQGPLVVEFQSKAVSQNFLKVDGSESYDYEIPILLFGGNGEAINTPIEITVAANSASTAQEGVHYSFTNGKTVTIPAGETKAVVPITVLTRDLSATNPPVLILDIVSSSQTISDSSQTKVTLQAICPSDLAGDYQYINGSGRPVTVTKTGDGVYRVSRDNYFRSAYWIEISDVCNELTVTDGQINSFGIPVSGYGSVDPATGNITIVYTVQGYLDNREMIMQRQ